MSIGITWQWVRNAKGSVEQREKEVFWDSDSMSGYTSKVTWDVRNVDSQIPLGISNWNFHKLLYRFSLSVGFGSSIKNCRAKAKGTEKGKWL